MHCQLDSSGVNLRVIAFTSLRNHHEFFFKAERSAPNAAASRARIHSQHARGSRQSQAGEEWTLTQISVAPTEAYAKRLAKLPEDANEAALLETILGVQTQPLDKYVHERSRQVVIPNRRR